MKAFYRVSEVQEILNMGRTKTYDLIRGGVIPSVVIDGNIRVPVKEFDDWQQNLIDSSQGNPGRAEEGIPGKFGTGPASADSEGRHHPSKRS